MSIVEQEELWTTIAKQQFEGRTIVAVRYMSIEEMEQLGWTRRSVMLELDNGNVIWPSVEGGSGGPAVLFTNDAKEPVILIL